jgi:hypothetical protein
MQRAITFQRSHPNDLVISIKLKVSECFCREHHAPVANQLLDEYRTCHPLDPTICKYIEHESGPELIFLAATLGIVKSVVELVVAILNSRREGRKGIVNMELPSLSCEGFPPRAIIVKGESWR